MKYAIAILALITILLVVPPVHAQPASAGFVASSDVLGIRCGGSWNVGDYSTYAYDFLDYGASKSSRVFAQGVALISPSCGVSIYGAGLVWQPDISKLFKSTNIPVGNVLFSFEGSAGNAIPSVGPDKVSAIAGAKVQYIINDSLTWNTIRCGVMFYGSQRDPYCSSGLATYWGGTPASPVVSSNVRKGLLKRIADATRRLKAAQ